MATSIQFSSDQQERAAVERGYFTFVALLLIAISIAGFVLWIRVEDACH